jgi:hypothetical protein
MNSKPLFLKLLLLSAKNRHVFACLEFVGALVDILASILAELAYFFHADSETPISLSLSISSLGELKDMQFSFVNASLLFISHM